MSIYEQLDINESTLVKYKRMGLLRSTAERDLAVYECYLSEKKSVGSMQAYMNTAVKHFMSEDNVRRIISKFKTWK